MPLNLEDLFRDLGNIDTGTKFNKKPNKQEVKLETSADGQGSGTDDSASDGDSTDEESDGNGKKKPKDGSNESSDGDNDDDSATTNDGEEAIDVASKSLYQYKSILSSLRKDIKKLSKQASAHKVEEELLEGTKAYDALVKLQNIVNDRSRDPMIADIGDVEVFNKVLALDAAFAVKLMQSIPLDYDYKQMTPESANVLSDIKLTISEILNAVSTSDATALLLGSRTLWRNLFSANIMLNGDASLVNGALEGQRQDLWLLYQLFTAADNDHQATLQGVAHDRDGVGDNALEPDITIIKPMFMLFPCESLKRKLRQLDIAERFVGADDVRGDYGILGFFSIPTVFAGNNANDLTPAEENRGPEGLFSDRLLFGDNEVPAINAPAFTWSNNGSINVNQKTLAKYERNNDQFVKDIADLYNAAKAKHLAEYNIDVCFSIVLTGYLNAMFKVLCEANISGVDHQVDIGVKLNESRFIATSNDDLLFKLLSTTPFGLDNKGKYQYKSLYSLPKYFADGMLSKQLGNRFHYSEYAYNWLRKEFRTQTFQTSGSTDFYVGPAKIGNHVIKIVIAPKLYLPVDVSVEINDANIRVDYPRSLRGDVMNADTRPIIDNPFSFAFQCRRTKLLARYNRNENNYILNISLFHTLCQMTNAEYAAILDYFYNYGRNYITLGSGHIQDRSIATFFGRVISDVNNVGDHGNHWIGYPRLLSGIAPFYKKSEILGLTPMRFQDYKRNNNFLAYPLMDKLFTFNAFNNVDTALLNDARVFRLSDYIRAIYNKHADFSWYEMMIAATVIQCCYMDTPLMADDDEDNIHHFGTVHFYLNDGGGNANRMQVSTVMRRAREYMEKEGLPITRIDLEMVSSEYPTTGGSIISKQDYINAFRFSTYDRTNAYVVDALYGQNFSAKKYWFTVEAGAITGINRLCKEDEAVNITRKEFEDDALASENLKGALLIYDNYHINDDRLNVIPEVIPGTGLVGYRFTSFAARNRLIHSVIGDAKIYDALNLNDYCYLVDDVYPVAVIYTVDVPTNTASAEYGLNYHVSYRNIRSFEVAYNIMHRAGLDSANPSGVRELLQIAFGVNANVNTRALSREDDYIPQNAAGTGFGNLHGNGTVLGSDAAYADFLNVGANEMESFSTTFRYAGSVTVPASGYITGMPKHINTGSYLGDLDIISMSKANHFTSLFGTIISNNRSDVQTYRRGQSGNNLTFYTLRGGLNNEYGDVDWNITLSYTINSIINALGMKEDK